MEFSEIANRIGHIPHMTKNKGEIIYELIENNPIDSILELGFANGTSSCYMAAALDEKKKGRIITIDNQSAKKRTPNIHELLESTGLSKYVEPIFANSSYNWELIKLIEKQTEDGICTPLFDFCYLDGAHNFEIDCCAFFLADKLLKPGSYILFDDLMWTYASSPSLKNTDFVKNMSKEEQDAPHIKKLFDSVVTQHSSYKDFSVKDDWALARKKPGGSNSNEIPVNLNNLYSKSSIVTDIRRLMRKMKNNLLK